MSLFKLFKKADPVANASESFRAFYRDFIGAPSWTLEIRHDEYYRAAQC